MGLYNVIFGHNPNTVDVLSLVEPPINPSDVPRYRDAWLDPEQARLVVYTRCGGGNYECWREDAGEDVDPLTCECYMHQLQRGLEKRADYVGAADDDFDCTYRSLFFTLPKNWRERIDFEPEPAPNPSERWESFIDDLKTSNVKAT